MRPYGNLGLAIGSIGCTLATMALVLALGDSARFADAVAFAMIWGPACGVVLGATAAIRSGARWRAERAAGRPAATTVGALCLGAAAGLVNLAWVALMSVVIGAVYLREG